MNTIQRSLRRVDGFQQRHTAPAFAFAITKKFGDDNGGALVSQLTLSMFMTVFPLLLLLVTSLGLILSDDPSLRHRVLTSTFAEFPIVGRQLGSNIHPLRRSSLLGLIAGLLGLVYGATSLAGTALYAMSQVWNIPMAERPNYISRMSRSVIFLLILAVGIILTTALSGFGTFGRHNIGLGVLGEILAAVVNVGLYFAAFRILTPKQVASKSLMSGVVVGGIAWTILQALGGYVVGHDLKGSSAVYGLFGLVLGLVAWLYLGAQVTIYAAEINVVRRHRLWPRALVQPPLTKADQESLIRQTTQNQRRADQFVSTGFNSGPMTEDEYRARNYQLDPSSSGASEKVPEDAPKDAPSDVLEN